MRFLDTLQLKVRFTRNESIALLLFSAVILGGTALRTFSPRPAPKVTPVFDYSKMDSAYAAARRDSITKAIVTSVGRPARQGQTLPSQPINVNTATKAQLVALPGIGPSYADRIIEYRNANGGFRSIDELARIKGIGPKKLEKLRPHVRLR